jgi:hypothetical protein
MQATGWPEHSNPHRSSTYADSPQKAPPNYALKRTVREEVSE